MTAEEWFGIINNCLKDNSPKVNFFESFGPKIWPPRPIKSDLGKMTLAKPVQFWAISFNAEDLESYSFKK